MSALAALALAALASLAGALALASDESVADHLYVSPQGNDSWPGTLEQPFATIARAQRAVRERTTEMDRDIVVNLRGGTYPLTEPIRFSPGDGDGGTGGHSVVYQGYGYGTDGEETPILSGGRAVSGWRPADAVEGAWQADVGDLETRQLFVAGRRAQRASLGGGVPGKAIALPNGFATRSTVPSSWYRPGDMELVFNGGEGGLPYSEARCGIAEIRGDAEWSRIEVDQPCFEDLKQAYEFESPGAIPQVPTDVENSLSFLREPGSWYLDRSVPGRHILYYLARPGEDPRSLPIVAPVLEQLVTGGGTADEPLHDLVLRGLTFAHATWLAPSAPTGFPQIIGGFFFSDGGKRVPGHVSLRAAERVRISDNRFVDLGGHALLLPGVGVDNVVRGNVISGVSGGGIELRGAGAGNIVAGNRVRNVGIDYRGSIAISLVRTPDATVAHNRIENVPYTGIWGESPRGLRVVGNVVRDAVREVPDGGGIYLPFAQGPSFGRGAVVRGNVVRDAGGVGVYPDVGADRVTVSGNVLTGSDESVSGVEPRRIVIARNYWDDAQPYWWPEDTPTNGVVIAGNTPLPRAHPLSGCREQSACAAILDAAGPR